jgi:predicted metalloprotease
MRWEGQRESDNVEDRRRSGGRGMPGMRIGGGRGIGLGTIVIALIAGWIFGINPLTVLGILSGGGGPEVVAQAPDAGSPALAPTDAEGRFMRTVLASTEDVWTEIFRQAGGQYSVPNLVLFRGAYPTACGMGQSAMGPFYCPGDSKVYIDLAFYDTLHRQLGAPGDFAQAYVIAHEVGHHVQNLMGLTDKVDAARRSMGAEQANALSVRLELQADCFAGLWAHHSQRAKQWLEQGDIEEAMNAASKIGDDALQRQSQGTVVPESFTHGSSEQRMRWFRRGLESGQLAQCDTFQARQL